MGRKTKEQNKAALTPAIDDIQVKADNYLAGIAGVVAECFKKFDEGKKAEVELLTSIKTAFEAFIKETGVKPVMGWEKYFQPRLETLYPNRGWGRKSKDNYFRMLNSPEKKALFLNGQLELSTGRKKTVEKISDEQKLKNAIAACNKWLLAVKSKGKQIVAEITPAGILEVKGI